MSESKPSQRFHSLDAEQVEVLHQVLSDVVPIHGRGNFPTLELRPRDIIVAVRTRLEKQGIKVRDIRLNGSTASHVLVRDNGTSYKDLDLIFGVELPSQEEFQVIKESVLSCLLDCLPAGVNRERISSSTMKEAYVQKMVKVFNEHDRWSLISLSNNSGKNLELKFVSALRRQFEFSVDSFQIILDRLLESYLQQESKPAGGAVEHQDETAETGTKDSSGPESGQQTETSTGADESDKEPSQIIGTERGVVCEEESQPEQIRQSEGNEQDNGIVGFTEQKEAGNETDVSDCSSASERKSSEKKTEPQSRTETRDEPELSDTRIRSDTKPSEETQTTTGKETTHSDHTELSEHKEPSSHTHPPTESTERSELPEVSNQTKAESLNLADELNTQDDPDIAKGFSEDQISTVAHTNTQTPRVDERKIENETGEYIQPETERYTGGTQDISAPEESQDLDAAFSVLTGLAHSVQATSTEDPPESHSSEQTPGSPDTQDELAAPTSLLSDKKTSSSPSSCKASERLAHMVVLKHSSPKPPRRMCKKVAPNLHPSPVSQNEQPCLEPSTGSSCEAEVDVDPNVLPGEDPVSTGTTPRPLPEPSDCLASNRDLVSSPDLVLNVISTSAVEFTSPMPQEPPSSLLVTESLCEPETQHPPIPQSSSEEALEEQSHSEFFEAALDSLDTLVLHTEGSGADARHSAHTSDTELSEDDDEDEDEDEDDYDVKTKNMDLDLPNRCIQETTVSSPSSSLSVTPPICCLNPPVLSLSPPCCSPSPDSSSPYMTPPSHGLSSAILNANSPDPSFASTPLSFSPTSSCLSSPPYLTPPILSLSPPPLCPSPPFPCLSPTTVEAEDLVPQVSSDTESLIWNAESDEQVKDSPPQPEAPVQQLEVTEDHDYISLPLVPEPVSFPITIPSSDAHVLPLAQSGGSEDSLPPKTNEEPASVCESKINASAPEQTSGLVPAVEVLAESMYGDFDAAMDHLRYRLIATRNPEEIRGGGLLKYSNLLVRDYRPASETQIKTLERYMCSRFFIDFPDVQEQQRKILSYLKNHFIGEERSKYQYLMTLRRVVDDSTVCLMGHERRQTLNMITVLALKVLGEQNIIPNTDHVTCFYQPAPYLAEHSAPYLAEPSYCSYYIPQGGSTLLYQPYPLHLHTQTGLV